MKRILILVLVMVVFIVSCALVDVLSECPVNGEAMLKKEYKEAVNDKHVIELIVKYYTTWGNALEQAKNNKDIFEFCLFSEEFNALYSEIKRNLQTSENMLNQSLVALYFDISNFHMLPLIVDEAKAYEDFLDALKGSLGYEGLQEIIIQLKLLPEDKIGFESINSLNNIIIEAFTQKYVQITELYFEYE